MIETFANANETYGTYGSYHAIHTDTHMLCVCITYMLHSAFTSQNPNPSLLKTLTLTLLLCFGHGPPRPCEESPELGACRRSRSFHLLHRASVAPSPYCRGGGLTSSSSWRLPSMATPTFLLSPHHQSSYRFGRSSLFPARQALRGRHSFHRCHGPPPQTLLPTGTQP